MGFYVCMSEVHKSWQKNVQNRCIHGGGGYVTQRAQQKSRKSKLLDTASGTHLGWIGVNFSAVVLGLWAPYIDLIAALLNIFHRGDFQHIVDDGQKLDTVPQEFLTDALTCCRHRISRTGRGARAATRDGQSPV